MEENATKKRKSEILAILFGILFSILFIWCLVKFICRIWFEYQKERINRCNRQVLILNDNNSANLNLI